MSMEFRIANGNDYEMIIKLFYELDTAAIKQQPEHFQRGERTKEYIENIIHSDHSDFLLCVSDSKIIGFSLVYLKKIKGLSLLIPCKYAYIQDIVITESCRNKGFGHALMDETQKWARSHGADYLRLSVIPKNTKGKKFYEDYGMSEQMITMESKL